MSTVPRGGEIRQRWEPPDTIHVRYIGHLDGPHMREAAREVTPWLENQTYFFVLIDVSEMLSLSADARRATSESDSGVKLRGIAIVGASFHYRALGTLIARGVALLQRHVDNPLRFFSTEEEARAWLAVRRQEMTRG